MGGSLAAACRKKFPDQRILGISRNLKALSSARKKNWIHEASSDIQAVKSSEFIIVCTPVDTLRGFLRKIDLYARPGTVVTDVGSVKGDIVRWAAKQKFKNIEFVGAHPMAGSHERGIQAAHADLYDKGLAFVTPGPGTSKKNLAAVEAFWKKIASKVVRVEADEHDRIVAMISHLPHAAAVNLVSAAGKKFLPFAATGFADTTRIAQGHPSVWVPILLENRKALLSALETFEKNLKDFKSALRKGDKAVLGKMLSDAARLRGEISL